MQAFSLWYVYFDALLLRKNPQPADDFMQIIETNKESWPASTDLDGLVDCFKALEEFILKGDNWGQSICTIDQLNKVECDLCAVLNFLHFEKVYIKLFWGQPRRIEASLTHLYAYFQLFIRAFIPYETMTIFECKAAKKLCIKLSNLQDLVNSILKNINRISDYFGSAFFSEEFNIIKNFFQNFVTFIKNIPKIKKWKMFHVPELLKYITIVNPIEVSKKSLRVKNYKRRYLMPKPAVEQPQDNEQIKRPKSLIARKPKVDVPSPMSLRNLRIYSASCPHSFKIPKDDKMRKKSVSQISRFEFPLWIRRHSISIRKEVKRKSTLDNQGMMKKIGKGKSNTQADFRSPQKSQKPKPSLLKKQNTQPNKAAMQSMSTISSPRKTHNTQPQMNQMLEVTSEQERYESIVSPLLTKITQQYTNSSQKCKPTRFCISSMNLMAEQEDDSPLPNLEGAVLRKLRNILTEQDVDNLGSLDNPE